MTTTSKSQDAADVFWTMATHSDPRIAAYDSVVYIAAEKAMLTAIRDDYGVSLAFARKVRQLVADYGTDDTLTGTAPYRGIESYVRYIRLNPRARI